MEIDNKNLIDEKKSMLDQFEHLKILNLELENHKKDLDDNK